MVFLCVPLFAASNTSGVFTGMRFCGIDWCFNSCLRDPTLHEQHYIYQLMNVYHTSMSKDLLGCGRFTTGSRPISSIASKSSLLYTARMARTTGVTLCTCNSVAPKASRAHAPLDMLMCSLYPTHCRVYPSSFHLSYFSTGGGEHRDLDS